MIAIQKIGKSFLGALQYNLTKMKHPDANNRAILLDSNFASMDMPMIRQEVELVRSLRPALNRYVYHTSLNFTNEEDLSNTKVLAIAHDYMKRSGYTNNQYFIFRHYDADHPHIHLLINRIGFDGEVVSDSNNFRKSEAILRDLEREYNLIKLSVNGVAVVDEQTIGNNFKTPINASERRSVAKQQRVSEQRALTSAELAMMDRTGTISSKLILQEKLTSILQVKKLSLQEFIEVSEKQGISFLFNQASTGRVSGITYFLNDFKARGQALGNRYKWSEVLKHIDYEQSRDSEAISAANTRTRARYDHRAASQGTGETKGAGHLTTGLSKDDKESYGEDSYQPAIAKGDHSAAGSDRTRIEEKQVNTSSTYLPYRADRDIKHDRLGSTVDVQISDDVDDEAIYGKRRRGERKTPGLRR